mmetsp:Transcript_10692/g.33714  ORF Transcript_10692/g.33714 Transcript_10692/m.33714 type:complete len:138 (-) Transcript_10692:518-931(-)
MYPQNVSELLPDEIFGDELLVDRHYRVRILQRVARRRDAAEANFWLDGGPADSVVGACMCGRIYALKCMGRLVRGARILALLRKNVALATCRAHLMGHMLQRIVGDSGVARLLQLVAARSRGSRHAQRRAPGLGSTA